MLTHNRQLSKDQVFKCDPQALRYQQHLAMTHKVKTQLTAAWQTEKRILAATRWITKRSISAWWAAEESLRELDKLETKKCQDYKSVYSSIWEWSPAEIRTNPVKTWNRTLRDGSEPSVDPSTVGWSFVRNDLHGRVAVNKPLWEITVGKKLWGMWLRPNDTWTALKICGNGSDDVMNPKH